MRIPNGIEQYLWGAVIGAVALAVIGFSAGWVVTSKGAQDMAERQAEKAVVAALMPICVAKFKQLSQQQETTHLAALRDERSWRQGDYVEEQGWATMPGKTEPNDAVADACAEELVRIANK